MIYRNVGRSSTGHGEGPRLVDYVAATAPFSGALAPQQGEQGTARAKPVVDAHTPTDIWYARLGPAVLAQIAESPEDWFQRQLPQLKQQGYVGFLLDDGRDFDQDDAAASARLERILAVFRVDAPGVPLLLRNHLDLAQRHADQLRAVVIDGLVGES